MTHLNVSTMIKDLFVLTVEVEPWSILDCIYLAQDNNLLCISMFSLNILLIVNCMQYILLIKTEFPRNLVTPLDPGFSY